MFSPVKVFCGSLQSAGTKVTTIGNYQWKQIEYCEIYPYQCYEIKYLRDPLKCKKTGNRNYPQRAAEIIRRNLPMPFSGLHQISLWYTPNSFPILWKAAPGIPYFSDLTLTYSYSDQIASGRLSNLGVICIETVSHPFSLQREVDCPLCSLI